MVPGSSPKGRLRGHRRSLLAALPTMARGHPTGRQSLRRRRMQFEKARMAGFSMGAAQALVRCQGLRPLSSQSI